MRAADKTVEFVKEWIAGTYTKRQYQNYYIVKTPHAQFLMKQTEARDLLAIRDTTGHIYLFDADLTVGIYGNTEIYEDGAMSNPFLCLLKDGYDFKYTRISPASVNRYGKENVLLATISKWKTLDRKEVSNPTLRTPVYLSIVEIGDTRFFISPYPIDATEDTRVSLTEWAQNTIEAKYRFPHPYPSYQINALYSNKLNTVDEIKGNYVAAAGDKLEQSWVQEDEWVYIPTDYQTIEDISGRSFREARKTRPNPYAYGLVGSNININNIHRRFETTDENAEAIKNCINLRDEIDSSNWKQAIHARYISDMANDYIAFFEADDAWLREHYEVAKAGALEARFRAKVSLALNGCIVYVNREDNPSPLSDHVVYIKTKNPVGSDPSTFLKVLPTPAITNRIKEVFNGDN